VIEDDSVIMDFSRSKMAVESHRDWVCSKVQYYYRMILSKLLRRVQLTAVHCILSDLVDFCCFFFHSVGRKTFPQRDETHVLLVTHPKTVSLKQSSHPCMPSLSTGNTFFISILKQKMTRRKSLVVRHAKVL
jgi:Cu/Ag efflux pump CusA